MVPQGEDDHWRRRARGAWVAARAPLRRQRRLLVRVTQEFNLLRLPQYAQLAARAKTRHWWPVQKGARAREPRSLAYI